MDAETAEGIVDLADNPEAALQDKERNKVLRQCLAKLSPEQGQVIEFVYYQEKSVKEVAELIGISVPTVKTRMFYARKRLAELVQPA